MLKPVFSIAYLRGITSVFYETTHKVDGGFPQLSDSLPRRVMLICLCFLQLRDGLIADIGADTKEVDVLKWMGRATLELLGQGAFGYSFDPLVDDTTNDFAEAVKSYLYVFAGHLLPPHRTH